MQNIFFSSYRALLYFAFTFGTPFFVPAAGAEPDCKASTKDIPVATTDATAATWANFRNNPGSIRFETAQLLDKALKDFTNLKPPADLCAPECGKPKAAIVFTSVPKKFLSDYSDKQKCDALAAKTKTAPFRYPGKVFDSESAFNDWYSDFSQGKGEDGSDLYAKCDGDCSPQYTTNLVPSSGKLLVDADVLCGPARDKDDNQYVLGFAYRWSCK